jgi:hypothetical protein
LDAAERFGIQLPRARCTQSCQKPNDLAREAVNCNAVFGRRVHLSSSSHITEREGEYAMK